MKNALLIVLVVIFAFLAGLAGNMPLETSSTASPKGNYTGGILEKNAGSYSKISNYSMDVEFDPQTKYITVNENILWRNLTAYSTNEIQFHFYPNAYKSNKTIFAGSYHLTPESMTNVEVKSITADGKPAQLIYFQPEVKNPHDSTVAKIILARRVLPSDSVKINIQYKMRIPRSVKRMGYATGRNFFFVSQWFPKVAVFEEGKWVCSQYHPYLNFYSDFGDYDVNISVPASYTVGATGYAGARQVKEGKNLFHFYQKGVHDFVWFATDDILNRQKLYTRNDGTQIIINAFVQPEREKYFDRYFKAIENSLRFFENKIGVYPYKSITVVDAPRTCAAGGMEYPTLITVGAELFAPVETHQPEGVTVHEFSHQFFYGLLANNEVYEAWLDEGFTTYITEKILSESYGREILSFKLAGFIPIYGMNLHSYSEIPVVYTLSNLYSSEGANSLQSYYKNLNIGAIADTSYKLPTRLSYVVNAYHKPALVLLTLERYLGYDTMMKVLKEYFNEFEFRHPKRADFYNVVRKVTGRNMDWFFSNFIENSCNFDYKLTSITRTGKDEYSVLAERDGDGIFKNDIALYTNKDTLYQKWDTSEKWKIFKFKTGNEVIGAEIDPYRKNLLDLNFANNSFAVKTRYGASVSMAMRWFFWMQNALMTLGGIG